eukprot:gene19333-biopygen28306
MLDVSQDIAKGPSDCLGGLVKKLSQHEHITFAYDGASTIVTNRYVSLPLEPTFSLTTPDSPPFVSTLFPAGLRPGLPCFKHPASPDYNGYGSNWSGGQFYAFNPATGVLNISLNFKDPATVNCYTKSDAYWLILWNDGQRIATNGERYTDKGFLVSNPNVAHGAIFSIGNRIDFIDTRPLALFYAATNGKGWHNNSGWMSHSVPPCEWYGVTCG